MATTRKPAKPDNVTQLFDVVTGDNEPEPKGKTKGKGHGTGPLGVSNDGLTNKQRAFVKAMLNGAGSQAEAYRKAYDAKNMKDNVIYQEAGILMQNPKISRALSAGFKRQEDRATHSGASLRAHLERKLFEMIEATDNEQVKLRAMELLGKSEKVGYFLIRTEDTSTDNMAPEEVLEQLEEKLKQAFAS